MNDHDDPLRAEGRPRREALAMLAGAGAWLLTRAAGAAEGDAADAPATDCIARPEQTEGPYFVDEDLDRADLRSDPGTGAVSPGVPLALTFAVARLSAGACTPLSGARIDLWHCDARGIYSDVRDPGFSSVGQRFLRGYQRTDGSGLARFVTIYPGAYRGRAVHVHFKIRTATPGARVREFTSQLYFDDALTDRIHAQAPYAGRARRLRNRDDGLFRDGGDRLLLAPAPAGDGLAARFNVGLMLG